MENETSGHPHLSSPQGAYIRPCVVKNTFIQTVEAEEDDDFQDLLRTSRFCRSESEPASLKQPPEPFPIPFPSMDKLAVSRTINEVDLSVSGVGRNMSGDSGHTSVGSTQPPFSDGSASSMVSWRAMRGDATDQSSGYTTDYSSSQPSISGPDSDADSSKKVTNRGSCVDPASWEDGVTTVMIRQVSRHYTQWMLITEVNNRGFEGLFDFVYLPFDFKKRVNVGYGFINLVDPCTAQAFRDTFDGTFLDSLMVHKGKPLRVHPATVQGYEANLYHFTEAKVGQIHDPQYSPLFLPRKGSCTQNRQVQQPMVCDSRMAQPTAAASTGWVTIEQFGGQMESRETPTGRGYCSGCGQQHFAMHNFCPHCGTRLEQNVIST